MNRGLWTGFLAVALTAVPALAGTGDFTGTWVNTAKTDTGFLSGLIGGAKVSDDIARIVVSPAGTSAVRVHLFGRCEPECDWGSEVARAHSGAAESADAVALIAEFKTGTAVKRLTLRQGPGRTLQFEVVTDFTDHSGRYDYIANGTLRLAPTPVMAAAPLAASTASVAPVPAPASPVPSSAAIAAAADFAEDCERINPEDVFVTPADRRWKLTDYNHTIVDFDSDKVAAVKASRVLEFYRFDEHCFVGRGKSKMTYWRTGGAFPRDPMPGADCVVLKPETLAVNGGQVVDGDRVVVDFAEDTAAAAKALSVLKTYRITRQCFAARPNLKMIYWLAN